MKFWCLLLLAFCLSGEIDVAQGCDFYCCAGNRTAFVEAGWQNCCSEAQCFETKKNPNYAWLRVIRREHYELQPCDVQCCRGMRVDTSNYCCSYNICRAVYTLNFLEYEELFATDAAEARNPNRTRVTDSWISDFSGPPTTTDGSETRNPHDLYLEQIIAAEKKQKYYNVTIIVAIFVAIAATIFGFVLRHYWLRIVGGGHSTRAPVSETVPLNSTANLRSSVIPADAPRSVPDTASTDGNPALPGKPDLPPSYDEVFGLSPNHTVLSMVK